MVPTADAVGYGLLPLRGWGFRVARWRSSGDPLLPGRAAGQAAGEGGFGEQESYDRHDQPAPEFLAVFQLQHLELALAGGDFFRGGPGAEARAPLLQFLDGDGVGAALVGREVDGDGDVFRGVLRVPGGVVAAAGEAVDAGLV